MKKLRALFCLFFGHSNIIDTCFGYIHCARCGQQIGDSLGGIYNNPDCVIVGHGCDECKKNYKRLSWKDKILAPNPFIKEVKE